MSAPRPRLILLLLAVASAAAVGVALVAQHRFGMEPCPWCILQRVIFVVLGSVALVAAVVPWAKLRRLLAALLVPLAASGVAAALWQHYVAAHSTSCALTFADRVITALGVDERWPEIFQVRASCADAAIDLAGVPFEFWSLALFALLGVLALTCAVMRERDLR